VGVSQQQRPSGPHDAVFRRVLGEPANAASQLRSVLPTALASRLDLDKLTQVPGSFVDDALRARYSDLVFSVPLAGQPALVYVLIEHQSTADPMMAARMLGYLVRIWERYLRDHPAAARLPVIIPLVLHSGQRPWTAPVQLLDLIDADPATIDAADPYLPRFTFLLDDLARVDEQALRTRPLTAPARVTLLLLKTAAGNPHLAAELEAWADELRAVLAQPGGAEQFTALLSYIELVSEVPADQLQHLIATLGPQAEEAYVTTADMLRAEGEARGRAEGEARGRAEGEARGRAEGEAHGRAEALVQLLTLKFGPLPQATLDTMQAATAAQLQTWTARVLTAGTLEQVLR
jgi:predicted transposase YdaD